MDSNFQVKITADLSDLQARIKSVETTLNKLQGVILIKCNDKYNNNSNNKFSI